MQATIKFLEYYLPDTVVTNAELAAEFPEWSVEKIEAKTGIKQRRIASADQCASDLAFEAAIKLFKNNDCAPHDVDFVLFCTQSPDYFLPTTACILQSRLGIPTHAGALDFNLGCSGYVYGLSLAKALIESGQAKNILLLVAETYSKYIHPGDKSVRTIFGDGAAATLLSASESDSANKTIGEFVFGTDGDGAKNLIVPAGCSRLPSDDETAIVEQDTSGNLRSKDNLFMEGSEIFQFTIKSVPNAVSALLEKTNNTMEDIDCFVFHQANKFMLDHLRKKMNIPEYKFVYAFDESGNTVSATIPIAIKIAEGKGQLRTGQKVMLVGFGVGYSWSAGIVEW